MITVLQWPPVQYAVFSLHGRVFTQTLEEPFVSYLLDGSVDVDPNNQTPGFVNRIQRFGLQNSLPEKLWDEQEIYFQVLQKLPLELRLKFFKNTPSSSPTPLTMPNLHTAPVPSGLAEAAGFDGVADNDPELPAKLAQMSPDKWLSTLRKWVGKEAGRKTKTAAGPVWWYAAHTVALNQNPASSPVRFIGVWLGSFPCRLCRLGGRTYVARMPVPSAWDKFPGWVNAIHTYVTSIKKS